MITFGGQGGAGPAGNARHAARPASASRWRHAGIPGRDEHTDHGRGKLKKKLKIANANAIVFGTNTVLSTAVSADRRKNNSQVLTLCEGMIALVPWLRLKDARRKKRNVSHHWAAERILYNFPGMGKSPKDDINNFKLTVGTPKSLLFLKLYKHSVIQIRWNSTLYGLQKTMAIPLNVTPKYRDHGMGVVARK